MEAKSEPLYCFLKAVASVSNRQYLVKHANLYSVILIFISQRKYHYQILLIQQLVPKHAACPQEESTKLFHMLLLESSGELLEPVIACQKCNYAQCHLSLYCAT